MEAWKVKIKYIHLALSLEDIDTYLEHSFLQVREEIAGQDLTTHSLRVGRHYDLNHPLVSGKTYDAQHANVEEPPFDCAPSSVSCNLTMDNVLQQWGKVTDG